MKDVKIILEEVLKSLPYDNKYSNVRFHVNKAIYETERIETKEKRRLKTEQMLKETQEKQKALLNPVAPMSPQILQQKLEAIDAMIAAEKQKLEQIQQRKLLAKQPPRTHQDNDDDGLLIG